MDVGNSSATANLPHWLQPRSWVCHLPTKTIFRAVRCQRDKTTGDFYLLDCTDRKDYPLTECDRLQLHHLQGVALLVTESQPLTIHPCPEGFIVSDGTIRKKVILEADEVREAAEALAKFFNGTVLPGEVLNAYDP